MYNKLFNFQQSLNKLKINKIKEMVTDSELKYSIYKNSDKIMKIFIFDDTLQKERELLNIDVCTSFSSQSSISIQYFFNKKDLYMTLAQFAYLKGYVDYKEEKPTQRENIINENDNWIKLKN